MDVRALGRAIPTPPSSHGEPPSMVSMDWLPETEGRLTRMLLLSAGVFVKKVILNDRSATLDPDRIH
jgi:hypothetical protein